MSFDNLIQRLNEIPTRPSLLSDETREIRVLAENQNASALSMQEFSANHLLRSISEITNAYELNHREMTRISSDLEEIPARVSASNNDEDPFF